MSDKNLTAARMKAALRNLDALLKKEVTLIIGGGGAMILAHGFPLATSDLDAVSNGMDFQEMDPFVKQVASELNLPPDWLNPYFSTFAHTLPSDYGQRLVVVFAGKHLRAEALGKEDMLIMKCFAHRKNDIPHAHALIRAKTNLNFVKTHNKSLLKGKIPGAREAIDFLDELKE